MKNLYMLSFVIFVIIFTLSTACAKTDKTQIKEESLSSVSIGSQASNDETCLPEEEKEPCE